MSKILILYSTTDGHTKKICQTIQSVIIQQGHQARLLAIDDDSDIDFWQYDKIVIGASIRYGRHNKNVFDFVTRYKQLLETKSSAFFSVNVVARKPGKDRPENNPYLQKFLAQVAWRPNEIAVFAGKIDYQKYRFLDRQIIRFIMYITKGPTDPETVADFTNWHQVENFGRVISEISESK